MKENRKATPAHNTTTTDIEWDGTDNEERLRNDQGAEFYEMAFAWRDPDKSESSKDSYRFIHHMVDSDGSPGAANIVACQTAIASINAVRGGVQIPEEDRTGVYSHLSAHLRDAEIEPEELRAAEPSRVERRTFHDSELRAVHTDEDGKKKRALVGIASPFGKRSEDMGFVEMMAEGAFTNALEKSDTIALFNHDANFVLGRESAGTLALIQTSRGLEADINVDVENKTLNDMVVRPVERGEIKGMSIGFIVAMGGDRLEELDDGTILRTITEVEELIDVSVVTFPAYPDTQIDARVALRSIEKFKQGIETNADNSAIAESRKAKDDDDVDYFNSKFKEWCNG